jgi:hypothetical protein
MVQHPLLSVFSLADLPVNKQNLVRKAPERVCSDVTVLAVGADAPLEGSDVQPNTETR